jgi:hypothetical protein
VALPALGIARIKAKIDTGARTSALHAYSIERFSARGCPHVRLRVHPRRRARHYSVECEAEIADERLVTNSGGHRERRIIIVTLLAIGGEQWPIEMSVSDRDPMRFPMLLGRTAMQRRLVVDPSASYLLGRRKHPVPPKRVVHP